MVSVRMSVANAMGTSVGSKALTIKQAIFIAAIFELAGAYLAGGSVTSTIRSGIVDADAFRAQRLNCMVFGMIGVFISCWYLVIGGFSLWLACVNDSLYCWRHYRFCGC